MLKLQPKNWKTLIDCAMGKVSADLAIANAQILNVFTGEILSGTVYVKDGFIAHVEYDEKKQIVGATAGGDTTYVDHVEDLSASATSADEEIDANEVYDAQGAYLIPGLIDAHVHIESSMMVPRNFAKAVIPWGTTTILHDPHEIGNVSGVAGVRFMHDSGADLPMRQLLSIPSCVPSVPGYETAGADFQADEIRELAKLDRAVALAEIMDYLAVIGAEDRMMDILNAAREENLYLQAHAPFLSGRDLSAYAAAGIKGDHESRASEEAKEKVRRGMYVDMRDSSMAKNVEACWAGVKDFRYYDHICLCTDDRESEDILTKGHINDVVNQATAAGMHPIDAIRSATYNTAREIGMDRLGAIAPGYVADMLIVDDLKNIAPSTVFFEGNCVAEGGSLTVEIADFDDPELHENTVYLKPLTEEDFVIKAPIENGKIEVNVMTYSSLEFSTTFLQKETVKVENGRIVLSDDDLRFVAVVNRHMGCDDVALHLVRNTGIRHGANASTVSHDSHNLTIVYDTPENALLCAKELERVGGGLTCVLDGKVLDTLELPVAGLMSMLPAEALAKRANEMKQAMRKLGFVEVENPLLRIATLALPVIPEVKMSDRGLIDVNTKTFIPLFA